MTQSHEHCQSILKSTWTIELNHKLKSIDRKLFISNYFVQLLSRYVIYFQAKIPKRSPLLKPEDLLLFSVYHCTWNIFGFWTVDGTTSNLKMSPWALGFCSPDENNDWSPTWEAWPSNITIPHFFFSLYRMWINR